MNHVKFGLLTLTSALVLAACGTTSVTPPPPAVTGTLTLNITGPSGVTGFAPNVSVTPSSGPAQTVTSLGNQNLTVATGSATVTVNPVTLTGTIVDRVYPGRINVAGFPTSTTANIAQGASTTVAVAYPNTALTGQLWLTKSTATFTGFNDSLLTSSGGVISPTTTLGAGTSYQGMAFDRSGNMWVADSANKIEEYNPNGTLIQTITPNVATSLNSPRGIAFDKDGNLWVANLSGGFLVRYAKSALDAGTGTNALVPNATISTVATASYEQIAFDATGNLWALDLNGKLYKFDAASLTSNPSPSVTMTGLTSPYGLSIDSAGKLWIASTGGANKGVNKYDPPTTNGAPAPLATLNRTGAFTSASATAFDKNGNLWVADSAGVYLFTSAQIATVTGATSLSPTKTFDVGGFARNLAFFPTPSGLPLFKIVQKK
jgi:sugar lactone lactonase YvrE